MGKINASRLTKQITKTINAYVKTVKNIAKRARKKINLF